MLNEILEEGKEMGLELNEAKAKIMRGLKEVVRKKEWEERLKMVKISLKKWKSLNPWM